MKEQDRLYTKEELKEFFQEYNQEFAEKIRLQNTVSTANISMDPPRRPTRLECNFGEISLSLYIGSTAAVILGIGLLSLSDLRLVGSVSLGLGLLGYIPLTFAGIVSNIKNRDFQ